MRVSGSIRFARWPGVSVAMTSSVGKTLICCR
jgi:hypothetical protein